MTGHGGKKDGHTINGAARKGASAGKKYLSALLICLMLALSFAGYAFAAPDDGKGAVQSGASAQAGAVSPEEMSAVAQGIINWKISDIGADTLLSDSYIALAGSTPGDWYPIALSRLGCKTDYSGYLAVLEQNVKERYALDGGLSAAKATEWHRIILAVLASGGNPRDIDGIDLVADGTYNRGKTASLGRQGINGWIWGLIALDSKSWEVPKDAYYTRDDIILQILSAQLENGGFALTGEAADPDITAMALQALAPYYNSETVYTLPGGTASEEEKKITVKKAAEAALECLSGLQSEQGDFFSWGTQNSESCSQVIIALCALGIDPLCDERFIKNGVTLWDGLMRYRREDGGFIHSFSYDSDNPASRPDASNSMAGEQALLALCALIRQKKGMRALYDFLPDFTAEQTAAIKELEAETARAPQTDAQGLALLLKKHYDMPADLRRYVKNYPLLSKCAYAAGLDPSAYAESASPSRPPEENGVITFFTKAQRDETDALPAQEDITSDYYVAVLRLMRSIETSEEFDGKAEYKEKLRRAMEQIVRLRAEISAIESEISGELCPIESVTLKKREKTQELFARYNALHESDREKILHYEDLIKAKTKLDGTVRAVWITAGCLALAALLLAGLIIRIKRRRQRRVRELEELAGMYEDEDEEDENITKRTDDL